MIFTSNRRSMTTFAMLFVIVARQLSLTLVSGDEDKTQFAVEKVLRPTDPQRLGSKSYVLSVKYSPDGMLLAAAVGAKEWGAVFLWRTSDWELIHVLRGHTTYCYDCEFSTDGDRLASVSGDGSMRLWDVSTGELKFVHKTFRASTVRKVVASPIGQLFAIAINVKDTESDDQTDRGAVQFIDAKSGKAISTHYLHKASVREIAFSPSGKELVSVGDTTDIKMWRLPQMELKRTIPAEDYSINTLVFSPDGKALGALGYDAIRLWDISNKSHLTAELRMTSQSARAADYSRDGTLLVVSDGKEILLLETRRMSTVTKYSGHRYFVYCVSFSPNSGQLASGSYDGTIRIWEVERKSPTASKTTEQQ